MKVSEQTRQKVDSSPVEVENRRSVSRLYYDN
jgi:hypothetical protein